MYTAFGKSRVVIYARVSTEHEAQLSALENQIDWYKPILEARPEWVLAGHYIDEGITGTSAEKRPQFMRMIEDAKHKKFDMIITREVSRFARNTVDTLQYTRMLKEHGVAVFFLNDNINTFDGDGELRLTIMATLAQDESRKTSIRVKSGQQTSMDNGVIYGNGNILGYTRYEWKEGDKKHVEMRINPEQAKTVRTIFDMYLAGEGLIAIKYELEKLGYKTSTGKSNWHGTVISHILKNTFYCGIMTYHKEYTPDYLKQKKVKNYGEMEYTRVQGTHEPIVTVEEFERVQKIMASRQMSYPTENNTAAKKGKKNRTTVWGKLLVCSCGHNFNMRFWNKKDRQVQHSFQCYGSLRTGSYQTRLNKGLSVEGICRTPMIPEWRLQMMANLIFRNYLNNKAKVLALANSMLEAHIDDPEEEDNTQELMEAKQQELAHLEKKLDGYIEMRSEGEMSKEMFTRKASEVDARIKQLQDELAKLEHRAKPKPVTNYREKLTVLQYALEQYTHVDEGKDVPESVIEAFVERIVASPDGFEWFLRFEGEPDKPLFFQIEGKRKKSAKVMIAGEISPSEDCSGAGCYQGLRSPRKLISYKQTTATLIPSGMGVAILFSPIYNKNAEGVCYMSIELKKLTAHDGRDVYDFLQTLPKDENGFINGAAGMTFEEFQHWCARCAESAEKTEIEDGWKVPQTTYWLYADGKPVGMGKLRHFLTDGLRMSGGHIGYAIAPDFRNRGYGKLLLKGMLREAKQKGIDSVLVTVHNDNVASIRVALGCGGVIEQITEERHLIWLDTSVE